MSKCGKPGCKCGNFGVPVPNITTPNYPSITAGPDVNTVTSGPFYLTPATRLHLFSPDIQITVSQGSINVEFLLPGGSGSSGLSSTSNSTALLTGGAVVDPINFTSDVVTSPTDFIHAGTTFTAQRTGTYLVSYKANLISNPNGGGSYVIFSTGLINSVAIPGSDDNDQLVVSAGISQNNTLTGSFLAQVVAGNTLQIGVSSSGSNVTFPVNLYLDGVYPSSTSAAVNITRIN